MRGSAVSARVSQIRSRYPLWWLIAGEDFVALSSGLRSPCAAPVRLSTPSPSAAVRQSQPSRATDRRLNSSPKAHESSPPPPDSRRSTASGSFPTAPPPAGGTREFRMIFKDNLILRCFNISVGESRPDRGKLNAAPAPDLGLMTYRNGNWQEWKLAGMEIGMRLSRSTFESSRSGQDIGSEAKFPDCGPEREQSLAFMARTQRLGHRGRMVVAVDPVCCGLARVRRLPTAIYRAKWKRAGSGP